MSAYKGLTPTKRGMKLLKENGYSGEVTEVFVKPGGMKFGYKKDTLGLFDAIVFKSHPLDQPDAHVNVRIHECLGAQFSDWAGVGKHKKKAEASPWLIPWLLAGNHFVIYGFRPWKDEDRRDECKTCEAFLDNGKVVWNEDQS